MRRLVFLLIPLALSVTVMAQNRPADSRQRELESMYQQYDNTQNAAGMGLAQPSTGSVTAVDAGFQKGDYHRAQEGDAMNSFRFSTERYDRFTDKFFMKGSFSYNFDREKNRKWSDVTDPYTSIPFIYGSSVAKDYDAHNCTLTFDLYTAPLSDRFSVGLRSRYEVADISGNRDPRPRTGCLRYNLTPSFLYTVGNFHIGLDGGFLFDKEKLVGLTTIQSYPNLYYYKMSGLDRIDGAISAYSGFKRQFIARGFLGEISFGYTSSKVSFLLSGGLDGMWQTAYGDKKQIPGTYDSFKYNFLADLVVKEESLRIHARMDGRYADSGADEYLQELNSSKDPETGATTETWETLYIYENRYMLKSAELGASFDIYGGCTETGYKWSAGARASYSGFKKDCYLPHSSFLNSGLDTGLYGFLRVFERANHNLDIKVDLSAFLPTKVSVDLRNDNIYTQEVLLPDYEFYLKKNIVAGAELTYSFPLNLGKAGLACGYVKLSYHQLKAWPASGRREAALSFGLFTF